MSEKLLLIDIDKCVGCYACEIACKQEHGLPLGPRWCRVMTIGPRRVNDDLHLCMIPTVCIQCEDPHCARICPVNAIERRADGIVLIDENVCTGCGLCIPGCPHGAMYFNPEKKVAGKCSLCASRTDDGLDPACVKHCIGGALQFVSEKTVNRITQGMHTAKTQRVCYTSAKWRLSL